MVTLLTGGTRILDLSPQRCVPETVLEAVRPSVYFRDRRIQLGQVIVGRPALRAPTGEEDHA